MRLIRSENVGPITFFQLLNRFGNAEAALEALPELARRGGRKKPFKVFSKSKAERELQSIEDFGGSLLAACETDYPSSLSVIADPPPVITVKGHKHLLNQDIVGIVGARNASAAAIRVTKTIANDLSENKIVIASGLARGIDTAAHQAALFGATIAVIGGGIDYPYPRENAKLQQQIYEQGIVIAEQPFGTVPQARHFPRRNRIISGVSLGVLIAEASPRSGSLITARLALEQGREIFAIPGSPLDPRTKGTNNLIRNGATLVESAEDILSVLKYVRLRPLKEPDIPIQPFGRSALADEQEANMARPHLMSLLSPTPTEIDELIRQTDWHPATVLTILLELELAGRIERHVGNRVSIIE
ncbi:DNA-processing protein DprA [Sneathiella marina]|uniref:DNA-processing protein DprA n=1 Tax=Sneathiella marina TaxID=2950108 RepID=A0ABY4VYY7_9PROT|nr:DNA-processing protein DprA [Sneathiella marina]USG60140.1 DNA-processing protein DprA [Sneathiella marina]